MFNSSIAYSRNGASINLHLTGEPCAVTRDVSMLYNYGVISKFPDDYKENETAQIVVQSDAGRVARGFNAMASSRMHGSIRQVYLRSHSKAHVAQAIQADATELFESIPRVMSRAEMEEQMREKLDSTESGEE